MTFTPELTMPPEHARPSAEIVIFPIVPKLHSHPDFFRQRHAEAAQQFAHRICRPALSRPQLVAISAED